MHEDYYGFSEKPFSLTPDPKYLYKSASHASALDLLQYAIRRREGFVVVTGDIGTGKTTLCRRIISNLLFDRIPTDSATCKHRDRAQVSRSRGPQGDIRRCQSLPSAYNAIDELPVMTC